MHTAPPSSTMRAAMALIDSGSCIWCESAPATATSYLCSECSGHDAERMLAKPFEAPVYDGAQRTA